MNATRDSDGTIHVSIEIPLDQEEAPGPDEGDTPGTDAALRVAGDVVSGAAHVAGKVVETIWDVVKPSGDL